MNEQIIKERQRTLWLILAVSLIFGAIAGLIILHPSPTSVVGRPTSEAAALKSLPAPLTSTVINISETGSPVVGQPAPDFTLKTLEGEEINLVKFRGQPVIINFWASWCAPCRLEMPDLQQTYETHRVDGLVILAINLTDQDTTTGAQAFVTELHLTVPVLLDETGGVSKIYQLIGLPTSVFVNRSGLITHLQLGPLTHKQLDQFTAEILK